MESKWKYFPKTIIFSKYLSINISGINWMGFYVFKLWWTHYFLKYSYIFVLLHSCSSGSEAKPWYLGYSVMF